ncbi:hypothetical protein MSPP1_001129 [Malassezia sp. CBS 17886]|nr:hypothetical protein MSPP1_001129 [Malassezia sp. CBS 17886]
MTAVDPRVLQAVTKAKPLTFKYYPYILRALVFHVYFVPTTLLLLPLMMLRALLPFGRGRHKAWSFTQTMGVLLTRRALRNMIRFGMQPVPPREKGWREQQNAFGAFLSLLNISGPGGVVAAPRPVVKEVDQYVHDGRIDTDWFNPPPLEAFRGIITVKTDNKQIVTDSKYYHGPALVEPKWAKTRVKGFWFMYSRAHRPKQGPKGSQKRRVVLYFHGGAGVTFSAGDPFMGMTLATNLSNNLQMDVFSVEYNLAPLAPFPVQIVQGLAAYYHLMNKYGYTPDQIFIGGDSFGGWMALQLELFLRTDGKELSNSWDNKAPTVSGVPGLLLLSPFLCAYDKKTPSRAKFLDGSSVDYISLEFLIWCLEGLKVGQYRPSLPLAVDSACISPICVPSDDLAKLPPSFMCVGGVARNRVLIDTQEVLRDEDLEFANSVNAAGGNMTVYEDVSTTRFVLPEEFRTTCLEMRKWIDRLAP